MNSVVEYALSHLYGLKEVAGEKDNPVIMKMYKEIGQSWVLHDEVAWCAAAHSWLHQQMGYPCTKSLAARSWEKFGTELLAPEFGCTVVFWRISPTSGNGHVGFFIRQDGDFIWVLGGNQGDQYNISKYSKDNLLSYRKIEKE